MARMLAGSWYYGDGEESEEGKRFKSMMSEISDACGLTSIGDFFPVLRRIRIRYGEKKCKALFERFDGLMQDLVDNYRRREGNSNRTMIEAEQRRIPLRSTIYRRSLPG